VCATLVDADATVQACEAAGVRVGLRGGAVRLSTHVYTTPTDVDRAVEVIAPFVDRTQQ
jgi:selenocysteine lyase/cysteine desulfurase